MNPVLVLPAPLRAGIEALARAGYPRESCGLLIGRREGAVHSIERITRARNLNTQRARDRYELDPRDFLVADNSARAEGLEVLGVWHSHPDHPARPSETDREAAWPEWSYVIVSVSERGAQELRSFRLNGGQHFDEESLTLP